MLSDSFKNQYLNLGCGDKIHPDWINVDFASSLSEVLKINLLQTLPFEDSSIKYIYHSHVLEHFTESDGASFLNECYRILSDEGILRIVLPDLQNIVKCYTQLIGEKGKYSDDEFHKFHRWMIIELFDQAVRENPGGLMKESEKTADNSLSEFIRNRIGPLYIGKNHSISKKRSFSNRVKWKLIKLLLTSDEFNALKVGLFRRGGEIHKWMYDKYSLEKVLLDIGFKTVELKSPDSSGIPDWDSYEFDIKDGIILNPTSLYIEASK